MKENVAIICCTIREDFYERMKKSFGDLTFFPVYNAKSLTSGYNEALKKAQNFKYKFYVHDDVVNNNPDIVANCVSIFESDGSIGMIGVIGCGQLPARSSGGNAGIWWAGQDLKGRVKDIGGGSLDFRNPGSPEHVEAIDGLFMATNNNIEWDERFDGFHFYDISQALRIRQAGLNVVVPHQESHWIIHDGTKKVPSGPEVYHKYRERFVELYL